MEIIVHKNDLFSPQALSFAKMYCNRNRKIIWYIYMAKGMLKIFTSQSLQLFDSRLCLYARAISMPQI